MRPGLGQLATCLLAVLVTTAIVVFYSDNPARVGELPLLVRASLLNLGIASALVGLYFLNPFMRGRPWIYASVVLAPAMVPVFVYFLLLLPRQAGTGITVGELDLSLITDRSSNGIVEVGFSYPIFTPTVELTNEGLFTREVMVFFRLLDASGESALFRAVRERVPPSGLSVEATVQGMLSDNREYLFNPLELPPQRTVRGRVVFIITSLDDGTTFSAALRQAQQAQLELREPQSGVLIETIAVSGL